MQHRYLGNSGLKLSEIAYGNWITHGSQVDDETATACVHAALDAGITTFDTADVYAQTRAETVLGAALSGRRREGLEICTKVFWPTGPGPNDRGLSRKHILESIDGSLRRLRTDHIDLYQAHRYDVETPLEETMLAFADVVRSGKALYIGVSEWTSDQLRAAHELARELHVPLVSNQPEYSALWRVIEAEIIPTCRDLGLGQLVWSPLAQGVLTGKYIPGTVPPTGSRATDEASRGILDDLMRPEVLDAVQLLVPIAVDAGLTMAQMAVAWVLRNPDITAAIVGASRPEQITETAAASGVLLDAEILTRIDQALAPVVEHDPARTLAHTPLTRP